MPFGEKETEFTEPVWPSNLLFYSPVVESQSRIDLSPLPDDIVIPSDEKQTE